MQIAGEYKLSSPGMDGIYRYKGLEFVARPDSNATLNFVSNALNPKKYLLVTGQA